MPGFPQTFTIVRGGSPQTVAADGPEALITLRTELELLRRFGAGATKDVLAALQTRLAQVSPQETIRGRPAAEDLQDISDILTDAMAGPNQEAILQIDSESPQIKAELSMSSIKKDTQQFRDDVVEQVRAGEVADADAIAQAFQEALVDEPPETGSSTEPGIIATEADPAAQGTQDHGTVEAILAQTAAVLNGARGNSSNQDQVEDAPGAIDQAELAVTDAAAEATADLIAEQLADAEESIKALEGALAEAVEGGGSQEAAADASEAKTDASDASAVAAAEPLVGAEAELDQIATALEDAAAALDLVNDSAQEVAGTGTTPDPLPVDAGAPESFSTPSSTASIAPAPDTSGKLSAQLGRIRSRINTELDELASFVQQVDQAHEHAQQGLARAEAFEQAAVQANEAKQELQNAAGEASAAKQAYDLAQARMEQARHKWESSQQVAIAAARAVRLSVLNHLKPQTVFDISDPERGFAPPRG